MIVSVALWVLFPLLICCQSAVHHTHVHVMYTRVLHVYINISPPICSIKILSVQIQHL